MRLMCRIALGSMLRFKYPYIHSQSLLLLRNHFFRVVGAFIVSADLIDIFYFKIITRNVSRDDNLSSIVMLVVIYTLVTRDVSRDENLDCIGYIYA